MASLPEVTTSFLFTPFTGRRINCRSNAQSRSHWSFACAESTRQPCGIRMIATGRIGIKAVIRNSGLVHGM